MTDIEQRNTVLKVENLAFSYAQKQVFYGWTHDFRAGVTWVRGGNGCGKSTLLKLIAGALQPRCGEISVQGTSIRSQPLEYRKQVFHCGPGHVVFDHLSAREFFGFMAGLYPNIDRTVLTKNVDGFELLPYLELPLASLSTGSQRKVWLAIALAAGTTVTLLDEPLAALDTRSSDYVRAILRDGSQDQLRSLIVVSHEDIGTPPLATAVVDLSTDLARLKRG